MGMMIYQRMAMVVALLILGCIMLGVKSSCPPAIFCFGDSLSDTGNAAFMYPPKPGPLPDGPDRRLPYRWSDGRLLIDFLAQALGLPFLSGYSMNFNQDYKHGVNFAVAGATARNTTFETKIHLQQQIQNYVFFKSNVEALGTGMHSHLPNLSYFSKGLYFIQIGVNDFRLTLPTYDLERFQSEVVPEAIQAITNAINELYSEGARAFLVVNAPVMGCLPIMIKDFGTKNPEDYNSLGCSIPLNNATGFFNSLLLGMVHNFRTQYQNATFWHADAYGFHLHLLENPSTYGITHDGIVNPCCKTCNVSSYISLDGLHFTEAFNHHTAFAFLVGQYVDPPFDTSLSCSFKLKYIS